MTYRALPLTGINNVLKTIKMNAKKSLLFIFSFFAIVLIAACGADPLNPTGCNNANNWANEVQDEADDYVDALTADSQNQTTENCNAYKQALLDYIDALQEWEDCVVGTGAYQGWQDTLNQVEVEANNIMC